VFFNSFTPILSPLGILKKVLISGYFLNKVFFCLSFNDSTASSILSVPTVLPLPVLNRAVYLLVYSCSKA
jgi:hypothetical protein